MNTPKNLTADTLSILLAVALQRAGVPPTAVTIIVSLGAAVGAKLLEILNEHDDGTPIETFRAELPDAAVAAMLRRVRETDG